MVPDSTLKGYARSCGKANYILTSMSERGVAYPEALAAAQRLGFAEADPTADVSGADAAAKAAILAGLAFGRWVDVDSIPTEGIADITPADMRAAAELGCVIRLVAVCERRHDGVSVRVHPIMLPTHHPLASIRGCNK